MAGGIDFNRGKFKELVVFFAAEAERTGDEGFGMVKLNKLLYRCDFEAYRLLGRSITGETYEKQEFGPVARDLPIVLDDLARDGRLAWHRIPRGPRTRKVPRLTDDPDAVADTSQFAPEEWQVIRHTLSELFSYGGKSASDWSHEQSAGWNAVPEYGNVIEYSSAVISIEPIPPEDLRRGREYLREKGFVT
jgi:hypothetical protein